LTLGKDSHVGIDKVDPEGDFWVEHARSPVTGNIGDTHSERIGTDACRFWAQACYARFS